MEISIIMGVYLSHNIDETRLAIDSVLEQSNGDFELLICFDGSDELTVSNVKECVNGDSRVKYINNSVNKGLAFSLNRLIVLSKGSYIARMDIDDYMSLDRLLVQKEFLDGNLLYDFVSSNALLFDNYGSWGIRKNIESPQKKDFLFNSPFIHAATMFRREALISVNNYTVSKHTYRMEDYDLWMKLYSKDFRGYNIQKELYHIREDKNAYSRRKYKYRIDEFNVRLAGFRILNLMPKGYFYAVKPLIVGLIPNGLLARLRGDRK